MEVAGARASWRVCVARACAVDERKRAVVSNVVGQEGRGIAAIWVIPRKERRCERKKRNGNTVAVMRDKGRRLRRVTVG